jgi:hypothetical protein
MVHIIITRLWTVKLCCWYICSSELTASPQALDTFCLLVPHSHNIDRQLSPYCSIKSPAVSQCYVVLCCRNLSQQSRTFPFNSPFISPYVRRSCWIQITVEEDEKGRGARWEYITLVLIVGTLEPISGKYLFLLRSYRLIHNYFPHARLKIVFGKFSVYLCNDECVITFSRRDHIMCLISSVSTYLHSSVHNSIVCARSRFLACVFKVLHECIQLYLLNYLLTYLLTHLLTYLLTYFLHGAESSMRRHPVLS